MAHEVLRVRRFGTHYQSSRWAKLCHTKTRRSCNWIDAEVGTRGCRRRRHRPSPRRCCLRSQRRRLSARLALGFPLRARQHRSLAARWGPPRRQRSKSCRLSMGSGPQDSPRFPNLCRRRSPAYRTTRLEVARGRARRTSPGPVSAMRHTPRRSGCQSSQVQISCGDRYSRVSSLLRRAAVLLAPQRPAFRCRPSAVLVHPPRQRTRAPTSRVRHSNHDAPRYARSVPELWPWQRHGSSARVGRSAVTFEPIADRHTCFADFDVSIDEHCERPQLHRLDLAPTIVDERGDPLQHVHDLVYA